MSFLSCLGQHKFFMILSKKPTTLTKFKIETPFGKAKQNKITFSTMWSGKQDYDARRKNYDLGSGKPDDFLPSSGQSVLYSPRKAPIQQKLKSPSSAQSSSPDEWLGRSPDPKKRSYRIKSIKEVIPTPDI